MKPTLESIGYAVMRIVVGLSMSTHGYGKIFGGRMESFAAGVADLGFPAPVFFAWLAALSELVGGICLALGLGTRISSFLIAGTMFVAAFIRNAGSPFEKKELAIIYLVIALYFLVAGGGRWAVDTFLQRRRPGKYTI